LHFAFDDPALQPLQLARDDGHHSSISLNEQRAVFVHIAGDPAPDGAVIPLDLAAER
jgi:hypothetical protein